LVPKHKRTIVIQAHVLLLVLAIIQMVGGLDGVNH